MCCYCVFVVYEVENYVVWWVNVGVWFWDGERGVGYDDWVGVVGYDNVVCNIWDGVCMNCCWLGDFYGLWGDSGISCIWWVFCVF